MRVNLLPDEFCDDGETKKLNKSRPYGTVYTAMLDEWKGKPVPVEEAAFTQDTIQYRGDGVPVGYIPAAQRGLEPVLPPADFLAEENEQLKTLVTAQTRQLASQGDQLSALLKRLDNIEKSQTPPILTPPVPEKKSLFRS